MLTRSAIARWGRMSVPNFSAVNASVVQNNVPSDDPSVSRKALDVFKMCLHQATSDLRQELGRGSVVVAEGRVFEYFDELRKVIETARTEVFFVDPYLDADFVSRYLPYVAEGYLFASLAARRNEPHCCQRWTRLRNNTADPLPCACRTDCMIGTCLSTKPLATCRARPSRTAQRTRLRF